MTFGAASGFDFSSAVKAVQAVQCVCSSLRANGTISYTVWISYNQLFLRGSLQQAAPVPVLYRPCDHSITILRSIAFFNLSLYFISCTTDYAGISFAFASVQRSLSIISRSNREQPPSQLESSTNSIVLSTSSHIAVASPSSALSSIQRTSNSGRRAIIAWSNCNASLSSAQMLS